MKKNELNKAPLVENKRLKIEQFM